MASPARVVVALLLVAVPTRGTTAQGARPAVPAHVGVVLDGPSEYNSAVLAEFQREMTAFFGAERTIDFPPRATLEADWTAAGTGNAIDRLFSDPAVDLVLALGPIGSNELAHRKSLPGAARGAPVGADVLRADRGVEHGDLRDAPARAGVVRDLRARPEDREVGEGRRSLIA